MSAPSRLDRTFGAEVSTRTLGLLRILIPTTLLFQFAYPWVSYKMDDLAGTLLSVWMTFVAAMFVILGYKTRIASVVMAVGFGVLHIYYGYLYGDGVPRLTAPVQVFQALTLLALTPCGRSMSVDRVLEVRRAGREGREPAPERMPIWILELFVIQTSAVYLWGAYDMADSSWLSGTRMEMYYLDLYGNSDSYVLHPGLPGAAKGFAYFAFISTAAIGVGLLIRPLRHFVAGYALILQCAVMWIYGLNWESCYFNVMMINMLVACIPPEPLDRGLTTVIKGPGAASFDPARKLMTPTWLGPVALGLALLYAHLGPYRAQVLERPLAPLVWDWKLQDPPHYKPYLELRYYDMDHGGELIERWALLGYERTKDMPEDEQRVSRGRLAASNRLVCDALRDRGDAQPHVELEARLTGSREWRSVAERDADVCGGRGR